MYLVRIAWAQVNSTFHTTSESRDIAPTRTGVSLFLQLGYPRSSSPRDVRHSSRIHLKCFQVPRFTACAAYLIDTNPYTSRLLFLFSRPAASRTLKISLICAFPSVLLVGISICLRTDTAHFPHKSLLSPFPPIGSLILILLEDVVRPRESHEVPCPVPFVFCWALRPRKNEDDTQTRVSPSPPIVHLSHPFHLTHFTQGCESLVASHFSASLLFRPPLHLQPEVPFGSRSFSVPGSF